MAILIESMEMPESCKECKFWTITSCTATFQGEKSCPLIEVPEPHGRLISEDDIDAAVNAIKNALLELKTARTVIPASESKERPAFLPQYELTPRREDG